MFNQINPNELWLALGTKAHFHYIPIHEVINEMDLMVIKTLPVFHVHIYWMWHYFSIWRKRKKTVWNTQKVLPNASKAFEDLFLMREDICSSSTLLLEQFVVILYDRTSDLVKVNDAKKWLFTQKSRSLDSIPPTQAALTQHIGQVTKQNCWNLAITLVPDLQTPKD